MNRICRAVLAFLQGEEGPTAVEYAVMLALIIVLCIASVKVIGTETSAVFDNIALKAAVSSNS